MIEIHPIEGLPEIRAGDDLAALIAKRVELSEGDILVVAQKAVSKAEGRVVRLDELEPCNGIRTQCPYKGVTSGYWSAGDEEAVAWSYAEPLPAMAAIGGHMAFFNERVDIEVDGVEQDRGPSTQWSTTKWIERARVPA